MVPATETGGGRKSAKRNDGNKTRTRSREVQIRPLQITYLRRHTLRSRLRSRLTRQPSKPKRPIHKLHQRHSYLPYHPNSRRGRPNTRPSPTLRHRKRRPPPPLRRPDLPSPPSRTQHPRNQRAAFYPARQFAAAERAHRAAGAGFLSYHGESGEGK